MSRSTQYFGLNQLALDFIKRRGVNPKSIKVGEGMFGEPLMGNSWDVPSLDNGGGKCTAVETIQITLWSSGPVILSCLRLLFNRERDGESFEGGRIFEWVANPEVTNEVDIEKGHYWL